MREIKFRGQSIKRHWVTGSLSILKKKLDAADKGCYISSFAGVPFAYQVRPETVGQFTGLHDKNGVEIYEGDFVEFVNTSYKRVVGYIEFDDGEYKITNGDGNTSLRRAIRTDGYLEIVGNIYENPELPGERVEDD